MERDGRAMLDVTTAASDLSTPDHDHDNSEELTRTTSSGDMCLELERPRNGRVERDNDDGEVEGVSVNVQQEETSVAENTTTQDITPDPLILAGIITNLRQSITELTAERDSLSADLTLSRTCEGDLRDALAQATGKASAMEDELAVLKLKSTADDETINILRSKVEESRRGVMRLQNENNMNKRMSHLSIDSGRANTFFGSNPSSSKRASFVPLTGSQLHRRTASTSANTSFGHEDGDSSLDMMSGMRSPSLLCREDSSSTPELDEHASKKSRRVSGFFNGTRPSSASTSRSPPRPLLTEHRSSLSSNDDKEKEKEKEEALSTLQTQLETTKRELRDAQDAREASEFCVRALRTFISDHTADDGSVNFSGAGAIKLPALPSDISADEKEHGELAQNQNQNTPAASGWSLKLWRMDSTASTASTRINSAESSVASPASEVSSNPILSTPSQATPISSFKKLGGLFASRRSVSQTPIIAPAPAYEPLHPHLNHQEPMFNGSDCSSLDESEPISPQDITPHADIMIRDISSVSTTSTTVEPTPIEITGKAPLSDSEEQQQRHSLPAETITI